MYFTVYEYQPSTGNYVAKGKLGWDTTNKKYSSDANASLKEALKTNFQENGNQGKIQNSGNIRSGWLYICLGLVTSV